MNPRVLKINKKAVETLKELEELQAFDKAGKIYIPKHIRDQFSNCRFYVAVVEGKIVLDPVKIEYVEEEEDVSVES
jgi:hypothetical protein